MKTVSSNFSTAIHNSTRMTDSYIVVDSVTYGSDTIYKIQYSHGVLTDTFELGLCPSAYVYIEFKSDNLSATFDNKEFELFMGVDVGGTYNEYDDYLPSFEYVSMGLFTTYETNKSGDVLQVHAFDRMVKLEVPFTSSATSASSILSDVLSGFSHTITLPSYVTSLTLPVLANRTKRQVLGYLAALCGANAVVGVNGSFKFVALNNSPSTSPDETLDGNNYFKFNREDEVYNVYKVTLSDGVTEWTANNTLSGNTSFDLYIESPYAQTGIADDILTIVQNTPMLTYTLEYHGNPAIELGDNIQVDEFIDEETTRTAYVNIGSIKLNYAGGLEGKLANIGEGKTKNTFVQTGAISTAANSALSLAEVANANASNALTAANGKNKVYYQTTQPTGGTYNDGDTWFDTDNDNKIYKYVSGSWTAVALGNNALDNLSANKLTSGTIDASVITVNNLNANNITSGKLSANYIEGGSLKLGGSGNGLGTISIRDASNVEFGYVDSTGLNFLDVGVSSKLNDSLLQFETTSGTYKYAAVSVNGFEVYYNGFTATIGSHTTDNSIRITTPGNYYVDIGARNGTYAHFDTNVGSFYFYKEINAPTLYLRSANAIEKANSSGYFMFSQATQGGSARNYGVYYTSGASYSDITTYVYSAVHTKFGIDATSAFLQSLPVYTRTGAAASNVQVNAAGTLYRVSSALKYKILVEDKPYTENILKLNPKTWYDKSTVERAAMYLEKEILGEDYVDTDKEIIRRNAGLIAEDLVRVGLEEYCIYGEPDESGNRELESIMYDRIWVELIPIIRNQKEQIENLKKRIDVLESI